MASVSAVKNTTQTSQQGQQGAATAHAPTSSQRTQGEGLASQERSLVPNAEPSAAPVAAPSVAGGDDLSLKDNQVMVMPTGSATTASLNAAFSAKLRGLGFSARGNEIRPTEFDGGTAWKFDWNPAWGPQTGAYLTNEQFLCVEAATVVVAAQNLPGYRLLSSADQTRLVNLLGSAENLLSTTARSNFAKQRASLAGQTAQQQADSFLKIINAQNLKPQLANEEVSTPQAAGTLSLVRQDPKYLFQGKHERPADVYLASFNDGPKIEIIAAKNAVKDPSLHYHDVQEIFDSLKSVMLNARATIKRVVLNIEQNDGDAYWAKQFNNPDFRAYMTASTTGEVNVFPTSGARKQDRKSLHGSMQHEAGHTLSFKDFGYDVNGPGWKAWKAAADKDGIAVSNYGMGNLHEDYAETARVFQATFGTQRWDEYNRMIPNRFHILKNGVHL